MYLLRRNVFYKRQRLKRVSDVYAKCQGPAEETRYHVCNKQVSRKRLIIQRYNSNKKCIFFTHIIISLIKLITGCHLYRGGAAERGPSEVMTFLAIFLWFVCNNYWILERRLIIIIKKKNASNILKNNYTVTIRHDSVDFQ